MYAFPELALYTVPSVALSMHSDGRCCRYYTTVHYYAKRKQHRARILSSLRASPIFANVPIEELEYTMLFCRPCHFHAGDQLFQCVPSPAGGVGGTSGL